METARAPRIGRHGEAHLPAVDVDSYSAEFRDEDGFIGDRASHTAFEAILERWRRTYRKAGADPFGEATSGQIEEQALDAILNGGSLAVAGIVQSAVEEFAQELARVIKRFLKTKAWAETERIVIGGGFRKRRLGQMAMARAAALLIDDGTKVELKAIANDPDHAALLGCLHLVPSWIFEGRDGIVAVDIGGTNIRVGLVEANAAKAPDLSRTRVSSSKIWRHADEDPNRKEAIQGLIEMLREAMAQADKAKFRLAPFIGVACPGAIEEDGTISRGAQNLPGSWEGKRFSLPRALLQAIPTIAGHEVAVLVHNDAVVQGLSEVPAMTDVKRWGVLTIGTGLGNARFTNRAPLKREK
jgi:hypothetical protein